DRDGQLLLRALLADHVLVKELLDFLGRRQRRPRAPVLEPVVVGNDVVADLDALIADEDRGPGNELPDVVLILVAEGATEDFRLPAFFDHLGFISVFSRLGLFPPVSLSPYGVSSCTACQAGRPLQAILGSFADDIVNNTVFLALV